MLSVILMSTLMFTILGSFLPATVTDLRMSQRDSFEKTTFLLAEAGLEEAIWGMNTHTDSSDAWLNDGWSTSADSKHMKKTIDLDNESYQVTAGYKGYLEIAVENPVTAERDAVLKIFSRARIQNSQQKTVSEKVLTMQVRLLSPFRGFVAKDQIQVTGNPKFGSYDSSVSPQYDAFLNSTKSIPIGAVSNQNDSVSLGGSTIEGNIVSGAFDPVTDGAVDHDGGNKLDGSIVEGYSYQFPTIENPETDGFTLLDLDALKSL